MPTTPQPTSQTPEPLSPALAELKQWFDQAGQILGRSIKGDQSKKTLKQRNQKVFDRLEKLQDEAASNPELKPRLAELTAEYERVTKKAQEGQTDYAAAEKALADAEKALKKTKRKTPERTSAEAAKKEAQRKKDAAVAKVVESNKELRVLKSTAALEVAVASGDERTAKKKARSIASQGVTGDDADKAKNLVMKVEYEKLKVKADAALETLKSIPEADSNRLENLLADAAKQAGGDKYGDAVVLLKTHTTVFESAKKAAISSAKLSKASEDYEQLAAKVRAAIRDLETMGANPKALEDLLSEAERLAGFIEYEKASKKLGGFSSLFKKSIAAAKSGMVDGAYEYNQLWLKTREQVQELDANPDANSKRLKALLDAAVAEAKPKTPDAYGKAVKKLATHDAEYKKAVALAKVFAQYKKDLQNARDAIEQLKLMPLADASALELAVATAKEHEGNSNYQIAIDKYVGSKAVKKMVAEAEKKAKAKQEAELKQLAAQPKYQVKLNDLQTFLAEYGDDAYHKSIAFELDKGLKLAEQKAADGDYVAALTELETQVKAKEAFGKELKANREKVLKDPKVKASRDALQASLDKLLALAEPTEHAVSMKKGRTAMGWALINPKSDNPEGIRQKYDRAVQEMDDARIEVDKRLDALQAVKTDCEDLSAKVAQIFMGLKELLPTDESAMLQSRFDRYSAAVSARRFEEAQAPLTGLLADVVKAKKDTQEEHATWEKELAKVKRDELSALAKCPATVSMSIELESDLRTAEKLANDSKNYAAATARVETIPERIVKAKETLKTYNSMETVREEAKQQVDTKVTEIKGSIDALETKINQLLKTVSAKPENPAAGDIRNTLSDLESTWKTRLNTAISEPELDLKGMLAALKGVADRITASSTDKAVSDLVIGEDGQGGKKAAQLGKAFNQEQRKGSNLLSELETYGGPELRALAKEHAELATQGSVPTADLAALTSDATDLAKRIGATLSALKHEVESTQAALNTAAAALRKKVDDLEKKVKQAVLKPAFDGLRQEVTDLEAMCTSTSLDSLGIARTELDKLDEEFTELESKFGSGAEGGLDEVIVKVKAIDAQLNASGTLGTCLPSRLAKLQEEYKTAGEDALKLAPAEALKGLTEFQAKIALAEDAARQVLAKRNSFDESYKLADTALKALLKKDKKSVYLKELGSKLSALKGQSVSEGEEDAAIKALEKLQTEISEASNSDIMMAKEKEARNAQLKAEQDALTWAKTLKAFKSNDLLVAEKAIKSATEGDMLLLKELNRMVSAAEGSAKGKDFVEAHRQLDLTRERAAAIALNPQGEKMTSRKNLMGDNVRWRKSVGAWNKAWTNLRSMLAKEAPKTAGLKGEDSALKKVDQLLNNLTFRYDLDAFSVLLTSLSNPKTPEKDGLKAREAALRMVRQYQTALLKSPSRSDLIDNNPFDSARAEAQQSERNLLYALESIQGNVQRAVG